MDSDLLHELPFTDIAPTGPEQVFDEQRIGKLFSTIKDLTRCRLTPHPRRTRRDSNP